MDVLYPRCGLTFTRIRLSRVRVWRVTARPRASAELRYHDSEGLLALSHWLAASGCTHVAMEATGVYWKPVWRILSDGEVTLILANAAHVKDVPGRKTDVADAVLACRSVLAHGRASFVPEAPIQEMQALLRTANSWCASRPATSSASRDAGGRQPQAHLCADPDHGRVRPRHSPGADRRRDDPDKLLTLVQRGVQSTAGRLRTPPSGPRRRTTPLPAAPASAPH